jgi:hypothetical protein
VCPQHSAAAEPLQGQQHSAFHLYAWPSKGLSEALFNSIKQTTLLLPVTPDTGIGRWPNMVVHSITEIISYISEYESYKQSISSLVDVVQSQTQNQLMRLISVPFYDQAKGMLPLSCLPSNGS